MVEIVIDAERDKLDEAMSVVISLKKEWNFRSRYSFDSLGCKITLSEVTQKEKEKEDGNRDIHSCL